MRLWMTAMCAALSAVVATPQAAAESTRFFEVEGFSRFLDSFPESTAITEDGDLALPPRLTERFADPSMAFATACGHAGRVVVSRVEDGQILSIDAKGRVQEIFKIPEAVVTAIMCRADGIYVAASGPGARLYRIDPKGRIDTLTRPKAAFVWDIADRGDGKLLLATGEPGHILEVDATGHTTILFASEQTHLKTVAYDAKLGVFAGGGERGVIYNGGHGKTFEALYDTGTTEITALLVRPPYVYAAGVSGSANVVASETTEAAAGSAMPGKKDKASEVRSQIVRIGPDKTVDILAGSADEAVFAMAFDARGQVLVATGATGRDDPRGRLYSIDPQNKLIAMVYQSPSRRLTHLVRMPGQNLAVVANGGARLLDVTGKLEKRGEFLTQPFDTGVTSSFGLAQILGAVPKGTGATLSVRTGQTAEPDNSWSPWSKGIEAPGNQSFAAPTARFVQARLELRGNGTLTPLVHRLRVAYLRQNVAPFVRDVSVLRKGLALFAVPRDDAKVKLVAVADKADDIATSDPAPGHAPTRARQVQDPGSITVKWLADDANGDTLRFALSVREADRAAWHLLKDDLEDPFYTFRSTQLADGYYTFRVQASDKCSNPDGMGKVDSKDSRAVLIDNTPPELSRLNVSVEKREVRIKGGVKDAFGPLTALTYALDGGAARPIAPDDGMVDGPEETFLVTLCDMAPGHHTIVISAADEADNVGAVTAAIDIKE